MRSKEEIGEKLGQMEREAQGALASFGQRFSDDPSYHLQWAISTYHAAAQAQISKVVLNQMTYLEASGVNGEALHKGLQNHCVKELCILANGMLGEPNAPTIALFNRAKMYVYGELVSYFYGFGAK